MRAAVAASLLTVAVAVKAQAATVTFEAVDLTDVHAGEDAWQYAFRLADFTAGQHVAFEVLFDPTRYRALAPQGATHPDWDILAIQPDPLLPDAGRYSALSISPTPSTAEPFVVAFVWLGPRGSAPASQDFEINAFDADGGFVETLDTGTTTPARAPSVPEPATLALLLTAMAVTLHRRVS